VEDKGGRPEQHLDTETVIKDETISLLCWTTAAKERLNALLGTREARRESRLRHLENEEADVESLKSREGLAEETKEKRKGEATHHRAEVVALSGDREGHDGTVVD
jgi:hypothetical protein